MYMDWIPAKTPAGVEEIASRGRRMPTRLRTVLILVDGRRSARHLSETAAALGNIRESLAELRDLGLIAPVSVPGHVAHEPASRASLPGAAPLRRRSLALARLYLLGAMEQCLRHADQPVRERLRSATTRAELLGVFAVCREIAVELGVAHIATIEARFMGMLPEEE